MKDLSKVTPAEVVYSYAYLAATMAEKSQELAECQAAMAQEESRLIEDGDTAAAAKAKANGSQDGLRYLKLKAGVNSLQEMIRCLKRAQAHFADEARNQY